MSEADTSQVEERRAEVRALQTYGAFGPEQVASLFSLLSDEDWRVRRDATDVALAMANARWLPEILDSIVQAESVGLRNACIELARAMGEGYARHLGQRLADSLEASPVLFDGIGDGDVATVKLLQPFTLSDDANISAASISALARVGGPEAETHLLSLLGGADRYRTIAALDGLRAVGAVVDFETLAPFLEDRIVWRGAIPLLGATGDPRAAEPLMRGLQRAGELARESALGLAALDKVTRSTAEGLAHAERERLHQLAQGDDVGDAALYLLIRARDERAVGPLLEALAEGRLTHDSVAALREWGSDAAPIILAAATPYREVALELAAELSVDDEGAMAVARAELASAMETPDPQIACAALRGLAIVGSGDQAEDIMRIALSSPDDVRAQAAATLSSISERFHQSVADVCRTLRLEAGTAYLAPVVGLVLGAEAGERLVEGLSADDVPLRAACASWLPRGGSNVVRHLAFAMSDESGEVRLAAAEALGSVSVGQDEAVGVLVKALEGPEESLARAAAEALGELNDPSAFSALLAVAIARSSVSLSALKSAFRLRPEQVDIEELLNSPIAHIPLAAAGLLEPLDERWPALLSHPLSEMRIHAAQSLSMWDTAAHEVLEEAMGREEDPEVLRAIRTAFVDAGGSL